MMHQGFIDRANASDKGLLGTWLKIPAFETVELLAHAGLNFVVIDMEHSPLGLQQASEMIFAAQSTGMSALVRLPDHLGTQIQPLLDAGADGLLVPRVASISDAKAIASAMVFGPEGDRGLGFTSRAGRWGLMPLPDYLEHGDKQCLRMIQLEEWSCLEAAAEFASLAHVNGLFVGLGDLYLSSGKTSASPEVQALIQQVLASTKEAGILSGIAANTSEEAKKYLDQGFSIVMVSNDATLFGRAAKELVEACQ